MRHALVGIALWVIVPQPVTAQGLGVSASHEEAAAELIEVMDIERQMLGGAEAMVNTMIQQTPQLEEFRDVIMEWASSFMTWEVFGPQFIDIYVEAFSESELRELTGFYKTPTGQKAIELMPELMNRGAQIGAIEAQERQGELLEALQRRAAELEGSDSR